MVIIIFFRLELQSSLDNPGDIRLSGREPDISISDDLPRGQRAQLSGVRSQDPGPCPISMLWKQVLKNCWKFYFYQVGDTIQRFKRLAALIIALRFKLSLSASLVCHCWCLRTGFFLSPSLPLTFLNLLASHFRSDWLSWLVPQPQGGNTVTPPVW